MDESVLYASLAAFPVISPYIFFLGAGGSTLVSLFTCFFIVPCCCFMNCALRAKTPTFVYPLLSLLCLPLAYLVASSAFRWNFQCLFVIIFGALIGLRTLLCVHKAPLKVPSICVSTRRRVAHTMASNLFPKIIPETTHFLGFMLVAALLTLPLSTNMSNLQIMSLLKELLFMNILMSIFYDTCLSTSRLFMTLPPLRLQGRKISEGLARGERLAFWETSLFVASGRSSREFVWEISSIGGKILNWGTMVQPALECLKEATTNLEKNLPKKSDKYNFRKPTIVDLPNLEQVIWSLESLGTLVYHAYRENKNGVTQVHFRQIMDTLFALERASQGNSPILLQDKIQNTLYKICTKYASVIHSLDIDQRYLDRFVNYSDFRV